MGVVSLSSKVVKTEIKKYLKDWDVRESVGVTLTLKQRVKSHSLDVITCSRNLKHFLNRLNTKVFGNGFKRFGKRLRVLPVIERSKTGRLHNHLTIQNPYPDNPNYFTHLIKTLWKKTKFGHRKVDVNPNINEGWNEYITKFNYKDDEVDWENFHK